jgi:putative ABC transport system permease protein
VVVNELALARLGFDSADEAINQRFYPLDEGHKFSEAIIVGVVPTQNIQGFFSREKPWVFLWSMDPVWMDTASIRIAAGNNYMETVEQIEAAWKTVIQDYPMNGRFLDEDFNNIFLIMVGMNQFIGAFALVVMSLAMIGLLGLAVFY